MLKSITRGELIKKGAEASVYRAGWYGYDCVFKERVPKTYRNFVLDQQLRTSRTKKEARLIHQIKECGIKVPYLYHIDTLECSILMEYIDGDMLRDVLLEASKKHDMERVTTLLRQFGELVGALHTHGFIHGDLTSSNVIIRRKEGEGHGFELVLIDFGLGYKSKEVEDKGVDLHVLLEAFESTHSDILEYKKVILDAYHQGYFGAGEVVARSDEIERRGRYR